VGITGMLQPIISLDLSHLSHSKKTIRGISVKNERGFSFAISKDIVEEGIFSANQFAEVDIVPLTMTELADNSLAWGILYLQYVITKRSKRRKYRILYLTFMLGMEVNLCLELSMLRK